MIIIPIAPLVSAVLLAFHLPIAAQLDPTIPSTPEVEVPTVEVDVTLDQRERALLMLSGYHGIPSAEEFEAAFDDPRSVMFALIQDAEVSPIHRDRAIGALAYWPNQQVEDFYVGMLAAPDVSEMVKHRVIGHLAVGFGDASLEIVAPYLESDDVQFRLTAVHALGQIGTPAALQRLDAAASVEVSDIVLQQIQQVTTLR